MKSLKIQALGLAALGIVAGPLAGAAGAVATGGPFTDTLEVTISGACTFARGTNATDETDVNHVNGDGTSVRGTWGSGGTADTLSGTLTPGEFDADFGSSNFVVVCNNKAGWEVTAVATNLTGNITNTENITLGTPAADKAFWSYTSSSDDTDITGEGTNSGVVAKSETTTDADGRTFSVKYAVSVDHKLSAQTYTGTIEYTFAQL